ncbi:hypothetical protein [Streptomyces anandii]|uniref:hypothetical protein n=1 Tax=Streptomyces anandii TaxID=285454 RepID=UPI0016790059|nr:hypothetical protein [Streptomyces anandii]GGX98438.1 hypothetical protein GCM10010510_50040 [Streptomyces anandii JCM 4720]
MSVGAAALLLLGAGVATATAAEAGSGFHRNLDPNAAPSSRPAAGPEREATAAASRPVSGKNPSAGPGKKDASGVWQVTTPRVKLSNTVTDADGSTANLTFEVWTADSSGNAKTQVKISDNQYGVLVSGFVKSGSTASVTVGAGRLKPNVDYVFHTSAYAKDSGLYETSWSPWARFRVTMPVDLTLPAPNASAQNPDQSAQPYTNTMAPPSPWKTTAAPSRDRSAASGSFPTRCTTSSDGVKVCGKAELYDGRNFTLHRRTSSQGTAAALSSLVSGCDPANPRTGLWTTRFEECSSFTMSWEATLNNAPVGTVKALVVNERQLDQKSGNVTERISVTDMDVPATIPAFTLDAPKIDCEPSGNCGVQNVSGWTGAAAWVPGDHHSVTADASYVWGPDLTGPSTTKPQVMKLGVAVALQGNPKIPGQTVQTTPAVFMDVVGGDLEKGGAPDQIRCDNTKIINAVPTTGCVFHNYVPTYTFNAAKYPQASSHAWLIQHKLANHPGSKADSKPLYFLPDGDISGNRTVICPTGWAAANGDTSALNGTTDKELNCDEFAFNATYNSGGMPSLAGGLNPVSSGDACVQTLASKQDGTVHLFNIDGLVPTWKEVCGRSAISGNDNSGSMAAFAAFNAKQRLLDRDPYWLNTNMSAACSADGTTVKCTMTANNQ